MSKNSFLALSQQEDLTPSFFRKASAKVQQFSEPAKFFLNYFQKKKIKTLKIDKYQESITRDFETIPFKYKYFSTAYYLPFHTILNNANIQSTKIKTFPITKINKTTIGIITIIETIDFILLLKSGK